MNDSASGEYIAGVRNLGSLERRHRLIGGWIGAIVCILLAVGLRIAGSERETRLFLFFPALISALGFLQARRGFCVGYGLAGNRNVGNEVGKCEIVESPAERRKDRLHSVRILAQSACIAGAIAFAAYNF